MEPLSSLHVGSKLGPKGDFITTTGFWETVLAAKAVGAGMSLLLGMIPPLSKGRAGPARSGIWVLGGCRTLI